MFKSIKVAGSILSVYVALNLLTGCGGASSSSSSALPATPTSFSVSGVVSDGAIEDATVWLDLDGNGLINDDEPFTKSDTEGNFNIETTKTLSTEIMLKAMGGIDTGTNLPFEGILEAKSATDTDSLTQMLTPLTTLKSKGLEEEEIRKMFPDLPEGNIDKMNPNVHKEFERIGMVVHSTIAQLTKATKSITSNSAFDDLYKTFADEVKDLDQRQEDLKFEALPLDKILKNSQAAIEPEKASLIQSMIKDTTKQMLDLNLEKIDNDQRLKEFQTLNESSLRSHFLDDMAYHNLAGEIHCGTNVMRDHADYWVYPDHIITMRKFKNLYELRRDLK